MSFKPAVFKRTKLITSPKAAVQWASAYVDETRKHRGNLEYGNGIMLGKNYFTSRPIGALTVHGYGKERTSLLARTKELSGNALALAYLREHCWNQRNKGRKIMGIRLVLSLDPAKIMELLRDHVDIDSMIVKVAEDTFKSLGDKFYNGDEMSFIMGIHHDGLVDSNASWVRKQMRQDTYIQKEKRPHIHAHLLLLPQTKNGVRISLSNHTQPGRDGQYIDMLAEALSTYQEQIQRQIYDLTIKQTPVISPEWEIVIREAAYSAMDDFFNADRIEDPKAKIRFAFDKFAFHMRGLTKDELKKRYLKRRAQFNSYTLAKPEETIAEVAGRYRDLEQIFIGNVAKRSAIIGEVADLIPNPDHTTFKLWDLPSQKPQLLVPITNDPPILPEMEVKIKALEDLKMASQMQTIGELSELEMKIGALKKPVKEPAWITGLATLSTAQTLPHQEVISLPPVMPVEPTPAPNIEIVAPEVPGQTIQR